MDPRDDLWVVMIVFVEFPADVLLVFPRFCESEIG